MVQVVPFQVFDYGLVQAMRCLGPKRAVRSGRLFAEVYVFGYVDILNGAIRHDLLWCKRDRKLCCMFAFPCDGRGRRSVPVHIVTPKLQICNGSQFHQRKLLVVASN